MQIVSELMKSLTNSEVRSNAWQQLGVHCEDLSTATVGRPTISISSSFEWRFKNLWDDDQESAVRRNMISYGANATSVPTVDVRNHDNTGFGMAVASDVVRVMLMFYYFASEFSATIRCKIRVAVRRTTIAHASG